MLGIIVCTHSNMARGLVDAVEMIAGKQKNLEFVDFQEGEGIEDLNKRLEKSHTKLQDECKDIVVCVDLYGASPFNASAIYFANQDVNVISGINLPMLLELCVLRESITDAKDLVINVKKTGLDSIKEVNLIEMFEKKGELDD